MIYSGARPELVRGEVPAIGDARDSGVLVLAAAASLAQGAPVCVAADSTSAFRRRLYLALQLRDLDFLEQRDARLDEPEELPAATSEPNAVPVVAFRRGSRVERLKAQASKNAAASRAAGKDAAASRAAGKDAVASMLGAGVSVVVEGNGNTINVGPLTTSKSPVDSLRAAFDALPSSKSEVYNLARQSPRNKNDPAGRVHKAMARWLRENAPGEGNAYDKPSWEDFQAFMSANSR